MLFRRIAYIFIVILMLVLYLEYPGWLSLFLLVTVIALPFVSLVSILPFIRRISVSLSFRPFLYPGEDINIKVSVNQAGWLTAFLSGTLMVVDISSKEYAARNLRSVSDGFLFSPKYCSAYTVYISKPGISDPLYLFRIPIKSLESECFYVFPREKAIEEKIDLSDIMNSSFVKKPGGGAAEAYEIRSYQPGDPVSDIHWKLSAKSKDDSLLVKEAQERALRELFITFDIDRDRTERDLMFSHLLFLLNDLKKKGLVPTCVFYSEDGIREVKVETDEDIRELFCIILSLPFEKDGKSLSEKDFSGRGWHYHVS